MSNRMDRFTEQIGRPVCTADGARLGRLRDLTVRVNDAYPAVHRLVVGRASRPTFVDWADLRSYEDDEVVVASDARLLRPDPANLPLLADELLLGRDVLDTQVVDVGDRRIARVGDLLLARRSDGQLVAASVDVSFGAVCRRLGLRRTGDRFREASLDWNEIHLVSPRGHRVQLDTDTARVHRLTENELAALLHRLTTTAAAEVLAAVPPPRAAAAIRASSPEVAGRIVTALEDEQLAPIIDQLPTAQAERMRRLRGGPPPQRRFLRHRRRRA